MLAFIQWPWQRETNHQSLNYLDIYQTWLCLHIPFGYICHHGTQGIAITTLKFIAWIVKVPCLYLVLFTRSWSGRSGFSSTKGLIRAAHSEGHTPKQHTACATCTYPTHENTLMRSLIVLTCSVCLGVLLLG